jgi:sigma-B regulation protein RsbU (phosphoserine phosphatase)
MDAVIALMPHPTPVFPGWDIWLFTRPANDVGGDLVDFLKIDDNRAFIVLGDVAGKGLPAALLMAKLQATLRALAPEFTSLSEIGSRVNTILNRDGLPNRFATLVYLEVSPVSGCVRVLNAGHMPPLLMEVRTSAQGVKTTIVGEMATGSLALSLLPDAHYAEQTVDLAPGDTMIVYSDGVTEAMDDKQDFFGDDRLRAMLPALSSLPVAQVGGRIVDAVDTFVGSARPHDDLSVVVLRRAS